MFPIRVKTVQESDLRMLGSLARNIQRVLPVTQADIDAAAALGKGWVVWKVFEVSDPLDNLRGGTQLIIRQNSVQPGQNVRRVIFVSGPGGQTVVIRGTDYIVLPDAIANSLSYVKAFGGTEQNGTPTPDAPVDIVTNNGVLKARHQSGLPLGYTLLEYITFEGTQYIDTGLAINNNTRALFDVKKSTSSAQSSYPWLGGVRDYINNTNTNKKTLEFSKSDSTKLYLQYATSGEITRTVPNTTRRHTYDFDKNKLYIDENLIYTATQETFTGNAAFLIGTMYSQGSITTASMFYGDVYGFKLWQDGTNLSMNLIPAKRNSDNVVGMYDLVSGQFFTNAGTGDFIAGTAVSDPVEIYTDGTVETIEDTIGNTATAEMLLKVGDYQDTQEILSGAITRNVGVKVLDGTENFETATATNCYSLTNTLGTGNFANRTIACSHFASTPTLPSTSARQGLAFIINKGPEYTIAFGATTQFSTQALWQQFLADQYAAGTPVIVIYPLATPTTESVAGQTLQVTDGDNTLEITQASIGGLELEAEYSAVVTLTVQEVEDANLDNNVTVTIQ